MANELRFRADHVGLLVPPADAGDVDAQVKALVALQRTTVSAATDGELRRDHLVDRLLTTQTAIVAEEEAKPLLAVANMDVKVSIPSASALVARTGCAADLAVAAIRREVEALVAAGVSYIQLNAPYGPLIDKGADLTPALEADRAVLADLPRSDAWRIGLRVGREGLSPEWNPADARLKDLLALPVDRFLLDFGAARGGFDVLSLIPDGVMAVLGLLDSADPMFQPNDPILTLIDLAAEVKEGNDIALSPRGGFNAKSGITWPVQQKKLAQLADLCVAWWGFAR